jgi:hypothetical protein
MSMPKPVPGDPLTGTLPVTHLVIPEPIMGPTRRQRRPQWPIVPDPQAVTIRQMRTGSVAYVRTRWGIRAWAIRTVNVSREIHNHGRHYFTGMNRHGLCRSAWVDRVVSVQSVQQALTAGRSLRAIGAVHANPR